MSFPHRVALRTLLMLIALTSLIWSVWIILLDREISPLFRLADRILSRETFQLDTLSPLLDYFDRTQAQRTCLGGIEHVAVIRLYAAAVSQFDRPSETDQLLRKAHYEIRSALVCSPHQGFL